MCAILVHRSTSRRLDGKKERIAYNRVFLVARIVSLIFPFSYFYLWPLAIPIWCLFAVSAFFLVSLFPFSFFSLFCFTDLSFFPPLWLPKSFSEIPVRMSFLLAQPLLELFFQIEVRFFCSFWNFGKRCEEKTGLPVVVPTFVFPRIPGKGWGTKSRSRTYPPRQKK